MEDHSRNSSISIIQIVEELNESPEEIEFPIQKNRDAHDTSVAFVDEVDRRVSVKALVESEDECEISQEDSNQLAQPEGLVHLEEDFKSITIIKERVHLQNNGSEDQSTGVLNASSKSLIIDLDDTEANYFNAQGISAERIKHVPNIDDTISFGKVPLTSMRVEKNHSDEVHVKISQEESLESIQSTSDILNLQETYDPPAEEPFYKKRESQDHLPHDEPENQSKEIHNNPLLFIDLQTHEISDQSVILNDVPFAVANTSSYPYWMDMKNKETSSYVNYPEIHATKSHHSMFLPDVNEGIFRKDGENVNAQKSKSSILRESHAGIHDNSAKQSQADSSYTQLHRTSSARCSVTSKKRYNPANTTSLRKEIGERFIGQKQILLFKDADGVLFDEINAWKEHNPQKAFSEACAVFADATNKSAHCNNLLKLVYNQPIHGFILKCHKTDIFQDVRDLFEYEILRQGLLIEKEVSIEDTMQVFLKIYGSFSLYCKIAEKLKMKKRLKNPILPVERKELDRKHSYFMRFIVGVLEDEIDLNKQYISFRRGEDLEKYDDCDLEKSFHKMQDEFFNEREQLFLIYKQLDHINIYVESSTESKRIGIQNLLFQNIYTSLFCLHNQPQIKALEEEWNNHSLFEQPLESIREYFGEKIALHFAFKGFTLYSLLVLAAFGLVVFVFGVGDVAVTWHLNEIRPYMRLFDNALTPWFALVTSVWGLLFVLFWQRKLHFYSYIWHINEENLNSFQEEEIRPQFKPKGYRQNVITGEIDVYFPASYRLSRQLVSIFIVALFWAIAITSLLGQAIFSAWSKTVSEWTADSASVLTALVGLVSMWILRIIYSPICKRLNDWENYRTDSQYEKALLFKRFSFEIINVYGRLIYFAFWRPVFAQQTLLGIPYYSDPCVGPCSADLMYQLLFIIVGDLIIFHTIYSFVPLLRKWRLQRPQKRFPMGLKKNNLKSVRPVTEVTLIKGLDLYQDRTIDSSEQHYIDDKLLAPPKQTSFALRSTEKNNFSVIDQQIYQIVQFGYMTLFLASFPLGAVLTSISTLFQKQHEARLFLHVHQRGPLLFPDLISMKTPFSLVKLLAIIAVTTNSIVIAFTSEFFEKEFLERNFEPNYWWGVRFGSVLIWHVVVYLSVAVVNWIIPSIPSNVSTGKSRQKFLESKLFTCNSTAESLN